MATNSPTNDGVTRQPTRATVFKGKAALAGAVHAAGAGLTMLLGLSLARLMRGDEYGQFAFAMSSATLAAGIAGLGLPIAILRFLPQYIAEGAPGSAHRVALSFWRSTIRSGLAAAGVVAAGGYACQVLGLQSVPSLGVILAAAALTPLISIACYQTELARSLGGMLLAYTPQRVVWPALLLMLAWCAGAAGVDITASGLLAGSVALLASTAFAQRCYLQRQLRGQFGNACRAKSPEEEWSTASRPMWIQSSAATALRTVDVVVVGVLLSPRDAGVYFAATRVAALVGFMLFATNAVLGPMIPRLYYAGLQGPLQKVVSRATRMGFWPSLAVCVVLAAFAESVLGLFGPDFVRGAGILRLLLIGQLINSGAGPVGYLMSLTGHQAKNAWLYCTAAVLQLVLACLLTPWLGLFGVTLATVVSVIAWNTAAALQVARLTGIQPTVLPMNDCRSLLTHREAA